MHRDPAPAQGRAQRVQGILAERIQVHLAEVIAQVAGIGQGQIVQIIDQMGELAHLGFQGGDAVLIERAHAVHHGFQFTLQHRQGRAQFMGDVREPALPGAPALIQALAETVDVMDQLADLVAAGAGKARLVLAFAQPPGMAGQRGDRRHQVPGQQPGHQQRQGQPHQRHGRHKAQ